MPLQPETFQEECQSEDEGIVDYKLGGYHPCLHWVCIHDNFVTYFREVIINRYVIIEKVGWGHFSTVWLCKDLKHNTYVALKI